MSVKKALALFRKLVVSGADPKDALAQASRMHAVPEKRLERAARAYMLSIGRKVLEEYPADVSKLSSEILRTHTEEFERILGEMDKAPGSPMLVLRQAYNEAIRAVRDELTRRETFCGTKA